jgi:hypothetical protein
VDECREGSERCALPEDADRRFKLNWRTEPRLIRSSNVSYDEKCAPDY